MAGVSVSFKRGGSRVDPYSGDTVYDDWDNPTTTVTDTFFVEPIASSEPLQDGRQAVIVGYRLYADHAVTVDPTWKAQVYGELFSVDGRPATWPDPFAGLPAGTVIQVGRTDA